MAVGRAEGGRLRRRSSGSIVEGVGAAALVWVPVAAALAGVTIVAGNLMAIPQQNIKRLLAYSGIAHIGYMLIGLAAMSAPASAWCSSIWSRISSATWARSSSCRPSRDRRQSDAIDAYRGLARRSPVLALAMLIFLLSLGGIPFLAGFWAKLFIFWAVIERGMYWLAFVGAVATVVALYYYLVVARRMYIDAPVRPDRSGCPRAGRGYCHLRARRRRHGCLSCAVGRRHQRAAASVFAARSASTRCLLEMPSCDGANRAMVCGGASEGANVRACTVQ